VCSGDSEFKPPYRQRQSECRFIKAGSISEEAIANWAAKFAAAKKCLRAIILCLLRVMGLGKERSGEVGLASVKSSASVQF
ncbi:hypothetical protein BaRGS_00028933, partial [Batillaria attramentaria]